MAPFIYMAEQNPKIVVDSIVDSEKEGKIVNVFPLTIRRYALLEKIGSPFTGVDAPFDVNAIVPAAYIMSTPKDKLRDYSSADKDKLIADAFDWSEDLELDDLPKMVSNLTQQLLDMNKAAPDATPPDSKKN